MMPISPKISAAMKKKHSGETVISFNGKILGVGKHSLIALRKARKIMPDIDKKEFLISRIPSKYIVI